MSLLIDEAPLLVLPSLAVKIGLHEALLLQQIHYWHQRKYEWVKNSAEEWRTQLPFLSVDQIRRALRSLERQNCTITQQGQGFNRAKSYRINYATIWGFSHMHQAPARDGQAPARVASGTSARSDQAPARDVTEKTSTETSTESTAQGAVPHVGKTPNGETAEDQLFENPETEPGPPLSESQKTIEHGRTLSGGPKVLPDSAINWPREMGAIKRLLNRPGMKHEQIRRMLTALKLARDRGERWAGTSKFYLPSALSDFVIGNVSVLLSQDRQDEHGNPTIVGGVGIKTFGGQRQNG